ncbi:MAG: FAD-dependent oxidoreductase, partial [Bacteroidota bacterium]
MKFKLRILTGLAALLFIQCSSPSTSPTYQTQVLVVGGGASGVAAAIQAARSGSEVLLVEETPWLGGMLTAAGVSATDGNHRLPSGLWGEFRQKLYDYYGGPDSVFTGWVSNTQFEPSIGNQFWSELAEAEPNLERWHGWWPVEVLREQDQIKGVVFADSSGERRTVSAQITIEATELGDVIGLAGLTYFTGQDTEANPHDDNIQDLTYAAILQDYGESQDHLILDPPDYDPTEFACLCREACEDPQEDTRDCETVLNYGRLPNGKYMINWPINGNDYYVNPIPMSRAQRDSAFQLAKERTLAFVHFLQTEAGFPNLGLAEAEFPTVDRLPLIPYHREARRVLGQVQLIVDDLIDPYGSAERPLYQQAIAVGDYPLDLHHDKNPNAKPEEFPPIPSFSVPLGCLIPQEVDGLIVAEKSISVTHVVNGATRLQPCVILIGQAAGEAAAQCVRLKRSPKELTPMDVQQGLLKAGCWLLPYIDVPPSDPDFESIQKVGLKGWLRGTGVPYKWANQTWFYPDSVLSWNDIEDQVDYDFEEAPEARSKREWARLLIT